MKTKKQRRGTRFAWLAWMVFLLIGILALVGMFVIGTGSSSDLVEKGYAYNVMMLPETAVIPPLVVSVIFLLIRLFTCWVKKASAMYRVNVISMIILIVFYLLMLVLLWLSVMGSMQRHIQDVESGSYGDKYAAEHGFLYLFTGKNDWIIYCFLFGPIVPVVFFVLMYVLMVHDAKEVRMEMKALKKAKRDANAVKKAEKKKALAEEREQRRLALEAKKEEEKKALEAKKAEEAKKKEEERALKEKEAALIAQKEAEKAAKEQVEKKEETPMEEIPAPAIAVATTAASKEKTVVSKTNEKGKNEYKPVYLSFLLVSLLTLLIQFLSIPAAIRAYGYWNGDGTVFTVERFAGDSEVAILSAIVAVIYLIVNAVFILIAANNTKKVRLSLRIIVFSSLASEIIGAVLNFICLNGNPNTGYGLTMVLLPILLLIATVVLLCVYKKKTRIQTYICFGAIALLVVAEAITNCLPQYSYWILATNDRKLIPAIVMAVLYVIAVAALIVFSKKLSDGYLLADSLPRRVKPKAPSTEEKLEALRKEYDQAVKDGNTDKATSLSKEIAKLEQKAKKEEKGGKSHFDGKLLQLIGYRLLGWLITGITFGIGYPWAVCFVEKWSTKHQVIDGKRLSFDGKGIQLFGKYIIWFLLSLITFGIYLLWLAIKMKKWTVSHTHLKEQEEGAQNESRFDGKLLQLIGYNILSWIITGITFGIAYPWAVCLKLRWETKHTIVDGKRLVFDGKGIQLFGKYIVWFLLSLITFGIYLLWLAIKIKKWTTSHIHFQDSGEEDSSSTTVTTPIESKAEEAEKQKDPTWTCPKCGHTENKDRFCQKCGEKKPE